MEYGLTPSLYSGSDEAAVKRRTVAKGALMPMPTFFVGSTGRYVQRRLMEKDGENYYASGCMYYDNAMLVAHTLGYMLAKGLHYEEGLKLVTEMRETKFQGCLGRVQIEKDTNDNILGEFSYYNLQDSNDSETLQLVNVATFSPYKTQRFTLIAKVQWSRIAIAIFEILPFYLQGNLSEWVYAWGLRYIQLLSLSLQESDGGYSPRNVSRN